MSDVNHHRGQTPEIVNHRLELRRGARTTPRPGKRPSDSRGGRNGTRAALRKLV